MKMAIGALLLSATLYSCGNGSKPAEKGSINIDAVAEKINANPDASGGNTCLSGYASKYDHLLTAEMAIKASGLPKEKLEVKYSKVLTNTEHHSVAYRFDMGRVQSNPAFEMPAMAMPDDIILKNIKAISFRQFENSYRAMTDEEQQEFEKVKDEITSGSSGDKDMDKAVGDLQGKGIDKQSVQKGVNTIGGAINKIAKAYTVVDGLGDAARWNTITQELTVLQEGVQFALYVNIAADSEKNKSVAVDLAKQILEKCD